MEASSVHKLFRTSVHASTVKEQKRKGWITPTDGELIVSRDTGLKHRVAGLLIKWLIQIILFRRPGKYDSDYKRVGRREYYGGRLQRFVHRLATLLGRKEAKRRVPGKSRK